MNVIDVLPKDAIPSIDDPSFADSYFGDSSDDVLIVDAEPARAYPIRILNYHEIVNDVLEGDVTDDRGDADTDDDERPIAVTWCPICGSAIVYDARVGDRRLTFGVSGKLADDDLVMYDRETGSEWKQSLGECIAGDLEGETLTVLPASMTTDAEFRESYPDGIVLQPAAGSSAQAQGYETTGYEAYADADGFGLVEMRGTGPDREWTRDDLDPKTIVLGLECDGEALGFPRPRVDDADGLVETTVGETDVVVIATDSGFHAFEQPDFSLRIDEDGTMIGDGTTWNVATGRGADGRRLERIPSRRMYAFGWQDNHGPNAFYDRTG